MAIDKGVKEMIHQLKINNEFQRQLLKEKIEDEKPSERLADQIPEIVADSEFLAKQNVSAPVTRLAKWKTAAQILALGFLMGAPGFPGFPFAHEIGITLLWLAAQTQSKFGHLLAPAQARPYPKRPNFALANNPISIKI